MKKLSNNSVVKILLTLGLLVVLAKAIALIALWMLPASAVRMDNEGVSSHPYYHINFNKLIGATRKQVTQEIASKQALSMDNFILHGLYGNEKEGYIIISTKKEPKKTDIIGIGEKYKGFRLEKIFLNYVVFTKNDKQYILHLRAKFAKKTKRVPQPTISQGQERVYEVKRSDIGYYSKNVAQIWRDISIKEIGKNGSFEGFKVAKIRPHSKIATLGLQSGDIITEVNGKKLKSYKDVLQIYQNINKLDAISLQIKRGNTQKEIYYEIH
ncbi:MULTISPECIES: PDZ domain-containing protein [Sulfurimonas]|uniref:PDZ domain-containing protein n=1 Tax=Sulfurimonas TaxID=202746 RepID=UPI00165FD613|nr:PDZ domain-containing protein [Sulfurimonas indica]